MFFVVQKREGELYEIWKTVMKKLRLLMLIEGLIGQEKMHLFTQDVLHGILKGEGMYKQPEENGMMR